MTRRELQPASGGDMVRMEDRAAQINAGHAFVTETARFTIAGYIEVGRQLFEAKAAGQKAGEKRNGRGHLIGNDFRWSSWIDANLTFGRVQAWRYMDAYSGNRKFVTSRKQISDPYSRLASLSNGEAPLEDEDEAEAAEIADGEVPAEPEAEAAEIADGEVPAEPEDQPSEEQPAVSDSAEEEELARADAAAGAWIELILHFSEISNSIERRGGIKQLSERWSEDRKAGYVRVCRDAASIFLDIALQLEEMLDGTESRAGSDLQHDP